MYHINCSVGIYGYKISKVNYLIEKNPVVIFFRRINHERFIAIYGFLPTYIEFIRHYRYALLLFGTLQLLYKILYRKHIMVVNTFIWVQGHPYI